MSSKQQVYILYVSVIINLLFVINKINLITLLKQKIYHETYSYVDNNQYIAKSETFKLSKIPNADIIMIGDSLTERCQWQELFPNHIVLNRGIGFDITEGLLHRVDSIIKHKPQKIFIMIGINDLGKKIPINTVSSNLKEFICLLRDKLPDSEILYKVFCQLINKI